MAFYEDILNGLTRVPQEQVPAFGALSVPMKAGGPQPQMQPAMAQPAQLMPETGGFDDLATFLAGMGEGGGALLPALGSGMRAVSGEKERRGRINETYNFLVKKGMDPDTAKAVMGNPELLKLELRKFYQDPREAEMQKIEMDMARAKLEAMKQGPEAPAGYRRNPDGSMTFIPGGPQDPATLEAQARAKAAAGGGRPSSEQVMQERAKQLQTLGIPPESAEGKVLLAIGKLPSKAYENLNQVQLKKQSAQKIAEGLKNLDEMANMYDDASFENAVGPFQGAVPDSLAGKMSINAARGLGEVANWWEGGKTAPSEVRSNIQGSTEALAAAIKPLIRGPGEGVWTDADQQRLVAVVGDLAQASTKEEFRRRLAAVRDRIVSNFALDVPFEPTGAMPKAAAPAPVKVNTIEEALKLPKGTTFVTPDGREKVR